MSYRFQKLVALRKFELSLIAKFNENHEPAGSPEGGQFTSGSGTSGAVMKPSFMGYNIHNVHTGDIIGHVAPIPPDSPNEPLKWSAAHYASGYTPKPQDSQFDAASKVMQAEKVYNTYTGNSDDAMAKALSEITLGNDEA